MNIPRLAVLSSCTCDHNVTTSHDIVRETEALFVNVHHSAGGNILRGAVGETDDDDDYIPNEVVDGRSLSLAGNHTLFVPSSFHALSVVGVSW